MGAVFGCMKFVTAGLHWQIQYFRSVSQQLLLLHGAIGASSQLIPLSDALRERGFETKLFNFTGHGGREIQDAPFSIPLFAEEVIAWMDAHAIVCIDVFGYSMGGYVALYIARHYPERVRKILTVATKFEWNVPTSEKEAKMLNPEIIKVKVPKFAAALQERHAPENWETVLAKTASMMLAMGENPPMKDEDFRLIQHHVGLCVGAKDTMVSMDETLVIDRLLNKGSSLFLPDTPHPIEQMNVELLRGIAEHFFNQETARIDGYFAG